jgi:hypothetical protein
MPGRSDSAPPPQRNPARVVVLKTSRFEPEESGGLREALQETQVAYADLIWISESSPITMFREGDYPPLRGTMIGLGEDELLFTKGSVPVYRTYPGLRAPNPLIATPRGRAEKCATRWLGCRDSNCGSQYS